MIGHTSPFSTSWPKFIADSGSTNTIWGIYSYVVASRVCAVLCQKRIIGQVSIGCALTDEHIIEPPWCALAIQANRVGRNRCPDALHYLDPMTAILLDDVPLDDRVGS